MLETIGGLRRKLRQANRPLFELGQVRKQIVFYDEGITKQGTMGVAGTAQWEEEEFLQLQADFASIQMQTSRDLF